MSTKALIALYLVVMLDVSGQGILFPALNTLIIDPANDFLPKGTSATTRNFYYGLIIGSFFFCWFFGATMIASFSDDVGRKKALIICLAGSALGYVLTLVGIYWQSVTLLVLGRVVAGFTAGSQSVSQAAIIDISTEETKAKNLGKIVAATAAGLAFGPVVGGIFSDKDILPEFNVTVPVYIITVCILMTLVLVAVSFKDVRETDGKSSMSLLSAFTDLADAVKFKPIRDISIVFFLNVFGLVLFYVFCIVYLFREFKFTTLENSIAMLVMGVAMALTSWFLIKPLEERFSKKTLVVISLSLMAVFQILFLLSGNGYLAVACILPLFIAYGVAYTNCLTIFSEAVPEDRQGWVMGISISLLTLGGGLASVFGEELMSVFESLPFLLSIGMLFIGSLLALTLNISQPYQEGEKSGS
ncbi:MAG: MFS transporter [Proteobacteria bacterium]|nr:MFS transporter [Pseudomonadota bacterium]